MEKKKPTAGTVGLNRKLASKMSDTIISPDTDIRGLRATVDDPFALLRCTIDWCIGHSVAESFSWADLVHRTGDANPVDFAEIAEADNGPAFQICRQEHHGVPGVYVTLKLEGPVTLIEAEALAGDLDLVRGELLAYVKAIRNA